ncbi:hypothetical protein [Loigolactobacillus bifermentans]|uniref:hypothetical protein n=1 Tax=Loigolactobacillus bifermentans TaxID=1607 RepID=UPI00070BCE9F|nr:hypothetical protein [Loigolactobacillus bifermentans]QGG59099.1 hypothetical protein LB003_00725 [Loigolactobacillus bifermentans]
MKKFILICATGLLGIGLAGCSNSSNQSSDSSAKTESVASKNNVKLAKDLEKQFNKDGKVATTKVEPEVVDDQSKDNKPHEEIKVIITDKALIKTITADEDAIRNDTATDDQKMYIATLQEMISKEAKKLDNTKDTISLIYKMDDQNNYQIAGSSKTHDFVKLVEVGV